MKKITFVLLALISGTAFAQNSTNETAEVFAEIVSPISIVKSSNLDFGKIAVGTAAGKVRIPAEATPTATYSVPSMKIPSTVVTPGSFTISAPVGTNYSISIPNATLTKTGGATMEVDFEHNGKPTGNTGEGDPTTLIVGGLLSVAANQAAGIYTGEVIVTVTYE